MKRKGDTPIDTEALRKHLSGICLFVTSTFGNGDPPRTGETLAEWLDVNLTKQENARYSRLSFDFDKVVSDQPRKLSSAGQTRHRRTGSNMQDARVLKDLRYAISLFVFYQYFPIYNFAYMRMHCEQKCLN